ncbi:MAG: hypothetical protein SCARUB_00548 [Candidatus Scalindua rubra]|uniref:Uncharacterized protein n=1 Tax=Candidatus Scalindua rubra TaxID=1872076 RepID=A0A1E3XFC3_9BACT|nr:MAG: hypothetical protein SCARUB_00548 [Candidatus Scalindua rubra]
MTSREKEVVTVIKDNSAPTHPTKIAKMMGVSGDYAEQICRDLVWQGYLVKKGLKYDIFKKPVIEPKPTR